MHVFVKELYLWENIVLYTVPDLESQALFRLFGQAHIKERDRLNLRGKRLD